MRRNYKSKFNELTPVGWAVVGGVTMIFLGLVIIAVLLVKAFV